MEDVCRQLQRKFGCEVGKGEKCPIRKCSGVAFVLIWKRPEQLLCRAEGIMKSVDWTVSNSGGVCTEFSDFPSGGSRFYGGRVGHKFTRWPAQAYAGFH